MKDYLQRMGRSLMLPVSVLPAAALLVGIGNWIMRIDGTVAQSIGNFLAIAGNGVLGQLALLFAVGLALGMVQRRKPAPWPWLRLWHMSCPYSCWHLHKLPR